MSGLVASPLRYPTDFLLEATGTKPLNASVDSKTRVDGSFFDPDFKVR